MRTLFLIILLVPLLLLVNFHIAISPTPNEELSNNQQQVMFSHGNFAFESWCDGEKRLIIEWNTIIVGSMINLDGRTYPCTPTIIPITYDLFYMISIGDALVTVGIPDSQGVYNFSFSVPTGLYSNDLVHAAPLFSATWLTEQAALLDFGLIDPTTGIPILIGTNELVHPTGSSLGHSSCIPHASSQQGEDYYAMTGSTPISGGYLDVAYADVRGWCGPLLVGNLDWVNVNYNQNLTSNVMNNLGVKHYYRARILSSSPINPPVYQNIDFIEEDTYNGNFQWQIQKTFDQTNSLFPTYNYNANGYWLKLELLSKLMYYDQSVGTWTSLTSIARRPIMTSGPLAEYTKSGGAPSVTVYSSAPIGIQTTTHWTADYSWAASNIRIHTAAYGATNNGNVRGFVERGTAPMNWAPYIGWSQIDVVVDTMNMTYNCPTSSPHLRWKIVVSVLYTSSLGSSHQAVTESKQSDQTGALGQTLIFSFPVSGGYMIHHEALTTEVSGIFMTAYGDCNSIAQDPTSIGAWDFITQSNSFNSVRYTNLNFPTINVF